MSASEGETRQSRSFGIGNVVGVILMIVGAAGLVLSLLFWSSWGGFRSTRTDTTIIRDDAVPR